MFENFPIPRDIDKLKEYINFIESYPVIDKIPRGREDSTETHHILPRCLGGSDDKTNLIELRVKDHSIAHLLLSEAYPDNVDLSTAAYLMRVIKYGTFEYDQLRERHIDNLKSATIDRNKKYFTMYKDDEEICVKREDKSIYEELGYVAGMSPSHRKKLGDSHRGKKRSEGTIKKLKDSNKDTHIGDIWITNGFHEITIPPSEFEKYNFLGYWRGRKPFSEEHRKNLSREFSEEHRNNISKSAKKRRFRLICQKCGNEFLGRSWNTKYCPDCKEGI